MDYQNQAHHSAASPATESPVGTAFGAGSSLQHTLTAQMTTSSALPQSDSDNNDPKHDVHGVTLKDPVAYSSPSVEQVSDDNEWEYIPERSSGHFSSKSDKAIKQNINSHGDMVTTHVPPLQWTHPVAKGDWPIPSAATDWRLALGICQAVSPTAAHGIAETSNRAVQPKLIEAPNHADGSVLDKATQTEGVGEGGRARLESDSQQTVHDGQPPNYEHATSAFMEGTSQRGSREKEAQSRAAIDAALPVPLLQAIGSFRGYGLSNDLVDAPPINENDLQRDWTAILDQFEHAQSIWQPGSTPTRDVLNVFDQLQFNMFMIVGGAPKHLRSEVEMKVRILYRLPHLGTVERKVIVGEEIGSQVLTAGEKAFPFLHTLNKRSHNTAADTPDDAKIPHRHYYRNEIENIAEDTSTTKAQYGSESTETGDEEEAYRGKKGGKARNGGWIEALRRLVLR